MKPQIRKIGYLVAPIAALALAFSLSACSQTAASSSTAGDNLTEEGLYERSITLRDGREVTCIVYAQYKRGGLSCDWSGASE